MAQALDKASPNHKPDTLADRHKIRQLAHHDAGDDSFVGARLARHLLAMPGGLAASERAKLK
jgi:hypothetical protein